MSPGWLPDIEVSHPPPLNGKSPPLLFRVGAVCCRQP